MSQYQRLTHELTNMFASERSAFDRSCSYTPAIMAMLDGREADAIELVKPFQTVAGDIWRAKAFQAQLIPSPNFVN